MLLILPPLQEPVIQNLLLPPGDFPFVIGPAQFAQPFDHFPFAAGAENRFLLFHQAKFGGGQLQPAVFDGQLVLHFCPVREMEFRAGKVFFQRGAAVEAGLGKAKFQAGQFHTDDGDGMRGLRQLAFCLLL